MRSKLVPLPLRQGKVILGQSFHIWYNFRSKVTSNNVGKLRRVSGKDENEMLGEREREVSGTVREL